jgi:hypothetical protein
LLSAEKPYTADSHWGATIAYTYTDSKQNNDNQDMTDTYALDEATIGQYPFIGSAVSRHRLVSTGTLDGPWGLLFATKLTLSTPIASVNLACYGTDTPSGCVPMTSVPPGSRFLIGGKVFGYRDIDFQVTKNFRIYDGLNAYIRFDLLNAFNWNNYNDYVLNFGSNGVLNNRPVTYNPIGNIIGVQRTVKLTLGLKF